MPNAGSLWRCWHVVGLGSYPAPTTTPHPRIYGWHYRPRLHLVIEVTKEEYDALLGKGSKSGVDQASPNSMSHAELATYVAERLKKLAPKKRVGVIRSIEAMFQFSGGITPAEIEKLMATLEKQKFFAIATDGKVTYLKA